MRKTFGQLIQISKDFCTDDSTSSHNDLSDSETFLKGRINDTVGFIHSSLKNYKTQPLPRTVSTVEDQIFYHNPPGLTSVESVTLEIGSIDYPLEVVDSQAQWDKLQMIDYAASTIPKYVFPRRDDFGIYPTPSEDDLTITLIGDYEPKAMTADDYDTGTISITQDTTSISGTDTTFTSAMTGRWFKADDDGEWYRIASFTDATSISLESYFEGSSVADGDYLIGESPEIPTELHELIPYRAAGIYWTTVKQNPNKGQPLLNFFYTGDFGNPNRNLASNDVSGGLIGAINRYRSRGRSNSQIVNQRKPNYDRFKEGWTITLTGDNFGN